MWFEPIVCLETTEDSMTLGVPNDFAAIWIHDNYLDLITQRLRLTAGRLVHVKLRKIDQRPAGPCRRRRGQSAPRGQGRRARGQTAPRRRYDDRGPAAGSLNPRNTFETFVVGSNNQMAHAAALAVAQAPAQAYNPLFLYGDTGLGKTHLMHAIGHAILRANPEARVAYLSTEKFTNEFIQASRRTPSPSSASATATSTSSSSTTSSSSPARSASRKSSSTPSTTSSSPGSRSSSPATAAPAEIQKLEARLVSRFEWGLPPTSRRPTSRPASPSSAPRPPA
jgi:chromosomal replication initiator protein